MTTRSDRVPPSHRVNGSLPQIQPSPRAEGPIAKVAVVLAAGRSQRLSPVTNGGSKAALRVGGIPLVRRAVRALQGAGLERVVVVVGYDADVVMAAVEGTGAEIVHAQDWETGNSTSLAAVEDKIGSEDRFVVMCGDHLFSEGTLEAFVRCSAPAVLVDELPDPTVWEEGTRVRIDGGNAIAFGKGLPDAAVDCGVFVLTPGVFDAHRRAAAEGDYSLARAVTLLAADTPMRAVPIPSQAWWQDVDTPQDLRVARTHIRRSLGKGSDGHISRHLNRPVSTRITMALAPLRLSPHLLSIATAAVGFLAAWLLAAGSAVMGGALVQVASVLDGTDGETARLQKTASRRGAAVDAFSDRAVDGAIYAGLLMWGLSGLGPEMRWWLIPMVGLGWAAIATSLRGPVAVFEIPRESEPFPIVLAGGRDARMLLIAVGAVVGLPLVAFAVALVSFGTSAIWRVFSVLSGRHHPDADIDTVAGVRRLGSREIRTNQNGDVLAPDSKLPQTGREAKTAAATGLAAIVRTLLILLFPVVLVAAFFGVLPRLVDLREVWHIVTALSWRADVLLLVLAIANLVTYWPVIMFSMPGLSLRQAAIACQSSTSVAMTVPAGGALAVGVSYAMYSSWGFTSASVASSALATFVVGTSVKLILPLLALIALMIEGEKTVGLVPVAIAGVAMSAATITAVALFSRGEQTARRIGRTVSKVVNPIRRFIRKGPFVGVEDAASEFHSRLGGVMRHSWRSLTITALISQLSVFVVLVATMRLTGVPDRVVSVAEALAVFAAVRLASSVPIVPGNAGFAELGYIGGLVLAGGGRPQAVAAVLLFRFLTYYIQIPIGGFTFIAWRRDTRLARAAAEPVPVSAGVHP